MSLKRELKIIFGDKRGDVTERENMQQRAL
jgi:hypothetical protein